MSQNIKKVFNNIYSKNNALYEMTSKGEVWISRDCGISSIYENIDTGDIKANLYFDTPFGRRTQSVERHEYLTTSNLAKLQNKGLDVMPKNIVKVLEHLRNEEDRAPRVYRHSTIGFGKYDGKLIYKLDKCIGIDSKYDGQLDLEPKGSKEEWLDMFKNEVLGQIPLESIIVISLSAVLTGFIGEENGLDTTIVHLSGNSSTGKSTALKLATSLFGYPDVKNNGLFSTFNTTQNAMMNRLTGIVGVPVSFDEISMSQNIRFTSMVYQLANGEEKKRLTGEIEQRQSQSWLTTIMTNGEKSLCESTSNYAGVKVRVFEFELNQWTKDANNAQNINKVILNNYGHIGYKFAKYIMNKGKDYVQQKYEKNKKIMDKNLRKRRIVDQYTARRVNKLGLFLATAEIFEEMIDINLNRKKIAKLLLDLERESINNRNLDKSIIDYLSEYITANKSKFKIRNDNNVISNNKIDIIGRITYKDEFTEVEILESKFKAIIEEGGFKDSRVLLKELKKQGLLDAEGDRHYRKRKLNTDIPVKVNVIRLPKK